MCAIMHKVGQNHRGLESGCYYQYVATAASVPTAIISRLLPVQPFLVKMASRARNGAASHHVIFGQESVCHPSVFDGARLDCT